ncbi:MAG: divalent metal cation transporter [Solirubrobacteraceae bacterium]
MPEAVLHLSSFVGSPLLDSSGERLGRVEDVIVRLDAGDELPPVTGLKARIGGREMFVPADRIAHLEQSAARASTTKLNLAQFERRPGEVLLRADLLGRSVINVATARLVRAREVELAARLGFGGWRGSIRPSALGSGVFYRGVSVAMGASTPTSCLGLTALIAVSTFAFQGTPYFGHFTNAGATATGLDHVLGPAAGALFAVVLPNASLIGAGALTLSTSYAFGDMTGVRSSLHRSVSDAKLFYGIFAALIAGAAAIVLIPGAPLGVITLAVQALAGVLLPSASVFLLLLCNDREVLGPWRNATWLNVLASVIVSVLVLLSLILMATTIFPRINVTTVMLGGGIALAVGLVGFGFVTLRSRQRARAVTIIDPTPSVPRSNG